LPAGKATKELATDHRGNHRRITNGGFRPRIKASMRRGASVDSSLVDPPVAGRGQTGGSDGFMWRIRSRVWRQSGSRWSIKAMKRGPWLDSIR
jgi:hypothetical protein